jgi:hypothetical protein
MYTKYTIARYRVVELNIVLYCNNIGGAKGGSIKDSCVAASVAGSKTIVSIKYLIDLLIRRKLTTLLLITILAYPR